MHKLKVGLLLDDYDISAWEFKMIQDMLNSHYASIELIVMDNNSRKVLEKKSLFAKISSNWGRINEIIIKKSLEKLYKILIERHTYLPNACATANSETLLKDIPIIKVNTVRKKWSDYFNSDDIAVIKQSNLDILVRCGFGILRGEILTAAKYGVWSFHHGNNLINRGGPAGFWESMESWPETGSILQILTEDLDNGKVLYRSNSCTDYFSTTDNKSNYYWKSLSFMTRKMAELHAVGEEAFFKKVELENKNPVFYSKNLYTHPTNAQLAKLLYNKTKEKLHTVIRRKFYFEQWILMFDLKNTLSTSLWRYKKILPPKDKFWADPHIIYKDNKYYIFIEEYLYRTKKGHISLMIMDEKGVYSAPEIIIDQPYHLSYPFVFEHENEWYMIPESEANKTIELYKCIEFPHKWSFQMSLMENVNAFDATLHHHNGLWWLFANVVETEGASSWDELFLFSSESLLSQNWTPHPLNPIVSDCKSARPAGKIFIENGEIFRPSQNCSKRYGYGFNLNRVVTLSKTEYAEEIITCVEPDWDKDIIATHTFNKAHNLHIIDAKFMRRK